MRNPILLIASSFFGTTFFTVLMPWAGLMMAEQNLPNWQIGLLGSVPWLAMFLSMPFVPAVAARYNPLLLYRICSVLKLLPAGLFLADYNFLIWSFAYTLYGVVVAFLWVLEAPLLAAMDKEERRAKWFSLYMWGANLALVAGPLLVAIFGVGPLTIMIGAACSLLSAILACSFSAKLGDGNEKKPNGIAPLLLAWKSLPLILLAVMVGGAVEGVAGKLYPVQAFRLGYTETVAAIVTTLSAAGNILSQLVYLRLMKRYSAAQLLRPSIWAVLAAILLIPVLALWLPGYLAIVFVLGGMAGALYTVATLVATGGKSAHETTIIMSGIAMSYTLGSLLAPAISGAALDWNLLWGLPLALAVFPLLAAAMSVRYKH